MFLPMSCTSPLTVAMTIRAFHLALPPLGLGLLEKRLQVGDGLLHHPGALDHLGQEHLAGAEEIADGVHAVHQRPFDDGEGLTKADPRFFGVLDDVRVDPLDQGVGQPLRDRKANATPAGPSVRRPFGPSSARRWRGGGRSRLPAG